MAVCDGHACACAGMWQAMAVPAFLACDYMPMHHACHGAVCADIWPLHAYLVVQVGVWQHTWFMDLCTSHHKCVHSRVYMGKSSFMYVYGYTEGDAPESTGSLGIVLSRTGFPTRLKSNKVGIDKGKTSRVIVREKLSKRAVVKEDGLGRMYLQERRLTPIGT